MNETSEDYEPSEVCYQGIFKTCPTEILLMLVILFSAAIAATVVLNLTAIKDNVSPGLTV